VLLTGNRAGRLRRFRAGATRRELHRNGIQVELRETRGGRRKSWRHACADPAQPGDLGFVQGGSGEAVGAPIDEDTSGHPAGVPGGPVLRAGLAVLYREGGHPQIGAAFVPLSELAQLQGLRVEPPASHGSGRSETLFNKLLYANRIERSAVQGKAGSIRRRR